jgi:hypothetical protein
LLRDRMPGKSVGHGRRWPARTLMLALCRLEKTPVFGTNGHLPPRFGTEGSEVQILSPRPIKPAMAQAIGPFSLYALRLASAAVGRNRLRLPESGQNSDSRSAKRSVGLPSRRRDSRLLYPLAGARQSQRPTKGRPPSVAKTEDREGCVEYRDHRREWRSSRGRVSRRSRRARPDGLTPTTQRPLISPRVTSPRSLASSQIWRFGQEVRHASITSS